MYFYRPRFGLFRRFVWFGLGAFAANWWIRAHDRRLAGSGAGGWCRTSRPLPVDHDAPPSAYAWPSSSASPNSPPTAHEHMAEGRRWGWHRRHSAPDAAAPPTAAEHAPVAPSTATAAAAVADTPATPAAPPTVPPPEYTDAQAELDRLQRAAEALWSQRKAEAVEATANAREHAREFAVANLHRLSALLDRIGASLEEEKRRAENEKPRWV